MSSPYIVFKYEFILFCDPYEFISSSPGNVWIHVLFENMNSYCHINASTYDFIPFCNIWIHTLTQPYEFICFFHRWYEFIGLRTFYHWSKFKTCFCHPEVSTPSGSLHQHMGWPGPWQRRKSSFWCGQICHYIGFHLPWSCATSWCQGSTYVAVLSLSREWSCGSVYIDQLVNVTDQGI